jgi:hypothetical protein
MGDHAAALALLVVAECVDAKRIKLSQRRRGIGIAEGRRWPSAKFSCRLQDGPNAKKWIGPSNMRTPLRAVNQGRGRTLPSHKAAIARRHCPRRSGLMPRRQEFETAG